MAKPLVIALLDTMWGGGGPAPRFFVINPNNFSGRRLYYLVGMSANLRVTNACRKMQTHANAHGTPDPAWVLENLQSVTGLSCKVLLICGTVAQTAYRACGYKPMPHVTVIEMPHPAARTWTRAALDTTAAHIAREARRVR